MKVIVKTDDIGGLGIIPKGMKRRLVEAIKESRPSWLLFF